MYNTLKKLYDENHPAMWNMAVAYLLNIGFRAAQKITDEDIERMEGNEMMTKKFVQDMVRITRQIAKECGNNVVEIIQFCQAESVFDTRYYTDEEEEEEV